MNAATDWFALARWQVETDVDPPLSTFERRRAEDLRPSEFAKSFGLLDFLVERDAEKVREFFHGVRSHPVADALAESFQLTHEELEAAYERWIIETH